MRILENPFFKILAICAIIYFGLFANKKSPESLGNRLSPEKIKKNLNEAQEKSKFIITNVRAAKDYAKNGEENTIGNNSEINAQISHRDINLGSGIEQVLCGSQVLLNVSLYSGTGVKLINNKEISLVVGTNVNPAIESHIYNMKKGGVREIIVPRGYKVDNSELDKLLQESNSDLKYVITLRTITKPVSATNLECK